MVMSPGSLHTFWVSLTTCYGGTRRIVRGEILRFRLLVPPTVKYRPNTDSRCWNPDVSCGRTMCTIISDTTEWSWKWIYPKRRSDNTRCTTVNDIVAPRALH
eukprot:PhF_6_TR44200/c0_g1_i1/m.67823